MKKEELLYAAEVMKAAAEGKEIEVAYKNCDHYGLDDEPIWDWQRFTYRIKPQPKYRPFNNAEEVFDAIKEHGDWVKRTKSNDYERVVGLYETGINTIESFFYFPEVLEAFTFADGTPFGKLEE